MIEVHVGVDDDPGQARQLAEILDELASLDHRGPRVDHERPLGPHDRADRLVQERIPADENAGCDLSPGVHATPQPRQPGWMELRSSSALRAASTSLTTKLNWA